VQRIQGEFAEARARRDDYHKQAIAVNNKVKGSWPIAHHPGEACSFVLPGCQTKDELRRLRQLRQDKDEMDADLGASQTLVTQIDTSDLEREVEGYKATIERATEMMKQAEQDRKKVRQSGVCFLIVRGLTLPL
jgi:hypothetical protein